MASHTSLRSRALLRFMDASKARRDLCPRGGLPMKIAITLALKNGFSNIIAAFAAWFLAVLTNQQIVVVFAISVIGACLFGLVGSILGHWLPGVCSTDMSDKTRWLANSLGALFIGPLLTWYIHDRWWPDAPIEFVAFFVSGVVGTFFVVGILLIPQWWLKRNGISQQPPNPTTPKKNE